MSRKTKTGDQGHSGQICEFSFFVQQPVVYSETSSWKTTGALPGFLLNIKCMNSACLNSAY